MKPLTSLSIFFPTYNEEENIHSTIQQALRVAKDLADHYEIIVVNDASTDRTAAVVTDIVSTEPHVRLVTHTVNQGYGRAVKTGLAEARHDYVFFTDADCQFDLAELRNLVGFIDDHDVVIGYRAKRMDPPLRLLNAKGWNFLNRILFDLRIKDIDCAFKLMRRDVVQSLALQSDGAMMSAELLIRLQQRGITCKEVAVTHFPRTNGIATGAKLPVIARALAEMTKLFFSPLGETTRQQLFLFALIGLMNTVLDLGVFLFLVDVSGLFSGMELLAKAASFSVGVLSSFALNSSFTFGSRGYSSKGFLSFLTVSAGGLLVNAAVFALARSLGVTEIIGVFAAAAASFVVGFALVKAWVFAPHNSTV